MDNITHTAIGAVFTECLYQKITKNSEERPKLRKGLHILSAFACNLPDFDLLMQILDSSLLGYLVNHRGHTHTIIGLITQLGLLALVYALFTNFFIKTPVSKKNHFYFLYIASFGLASHVLLDFLNTFGVHPFWPFNNSWIYGDSLFIIEPLLWITAALTIFHLTKSLFFKFSFLGFTLLSPLIFSYVGLSSWSTAAFVLIYSAVLFLILQKTKPNLLNTARLGFATLLLIITLFTFQSSYSKNYLRTTLQNIETELPLIDLVAIPFSSNFMCWNFLGVFGDDKEYKVYSGVYSSSLLTLNYCSTSIKKRTYHPSADQQVADVKYIKFDGIYSQKTSVLKELFELNCQTKTWFHFARVPFFFEGALHDLRYSLRSKKNFAQLNIEDESIPCPLTTPPWTPPRADILLNP